MYNPKDYRRKEWQSYRLRIWEADNHKCVRCGTGIENPRKAQIHHKIYLPDLMPWEYDETDCECLCASCHLEEHGRKMPSCDWVYIGCTTFDIYGDTTCDLCGSELKYEHEIWHPNWGTLYVGIGCCENLTSSYQRQEMRRQQNYLKRLSNKDKWTSNGKQRLWRRKFDGYNLEIKAENEAYRIYIESRRGKSEHPSFEAAIDHISSLLYSGQIDKIFRERGIEIPKSRLKKLEAYEKKKGRVVRNKSVQDDDEATSEG